MPRFIAREKGPNVKVSREKKQEHHQRFIDAFVKLVRAKGYSEVTLRDVARAAGLSDGAIYKYFASKEKILLAYYVQKMERLRREGEGLAKKSSYSLVEKLQALLEFQIGQYEGEKDFLEKTFHPTFVAASLMWSEVAAMRKAYLETAGSFLKEAQAKGEVPEISWVGIVEEILWCHYIGVMMYWLKDDSEHHEDTSQFIDRTLNLFAAVVGGPLLRQADELVGFLVNRHLMPLLMNLGGMGKGNAAGSKRASASASPKDKVPKRGKA
ncbi:MAG: transcriptional regulator, TetR family [Fibrobacteres bacterium]|nr:transcriptional regulator, TetR family [Fibrobacterota bacterium]